MNQAMYIMLDGRPVREAIGLVLLRRMAKGCRYRKGSADRIAKEWGRAVRGESGEAKFDRIRAELQSCEAPHAP